MKAFGGATPSSTRGYFITSCHIHQDIIWNKRLQKLCVIGSLTGPEIINISTHIPLLRIATEIK
ncbi:hypothetical protein H5410_042792 [Solanum commersonii]|uniref:Uncharacterized protein n=1 Tax=Solanum commersonii TaxID=4109 RepID=A0A9J5XZL2_SOLCO|nr:hypothetical protein H5410_042792 [Solanum commersonii]